MGTSTLVGRLQDSGQDVELELGDVDAPPALQLAVYRIVRRP